MWEHQRIAITHRHGDFEHTHAFDSALHSHVYGGATTKFNQRTYRDAFANIDPDYDSKRDRRMSEQPRLRDAT